MPGRNNPENDPQVHISENAQAEIEKLTDDQPEAVQEIGQLIQDLADGARRGVLIYNPDLTEASQEQFDFFVQKVVGKQVKNATVSIPWTPFPLEDMDQHPNRGVCLLKISYKNTPEKTMLELRPMDLSAHSVTKEQILTTGVYKRETTTLNGAKLLSIERFSGDNKSITPSVALRFAQGNEKFTVTARQVFPFPPFPRIEVPDRRR